MDSITTHITPTDEGWVLTRESRARAANSSLGVFPTQKKALKAAREIVQRSTSAAVVVHARDGSVRWQEIHGFPPLQKLPFKSKLGTRAIREAVNAVLRENLAVK